MASKTMYGLLPLLSQLDKIGQQMKWMIHVDLAFGIDKTTNVVLRWDNDRHNWVVDSKGDSVCT